MPGSVILGLGGRVSVCRYLHVHKPPDVEEPKEGEGAYDCLKAVRHFPVLRDLGVVPIVHKRDLRTGAGVGGVLVHMQVRVCVSAHRYETRGRSHAC
eukprot:574106-Rhodomonas_salina.1